MTAPARFKQADIKRAAAGVVAAGVPIAKIEIDPNGKIVIFPGTQQTPKNLDEWSDLE